MALYVRTVPRELLGDLRLAYPVQVTDTPVELLERILRSLAITLGFIARHFRSSLASHSSP